MTDDRKPRSFAEAILRGDAVSPTAFMGEGIKHAFERYRKATMPNEDQRLRLVIRAKDGTEIDLDVVRVRFEEVVESYRGSVARLHMVDKRHANENLAILDALVAALSVPRLDENSGHGSHDDFARCYNGALNEVSQAVGVVEREG